jgi:hypothetical protein
VLHDGAGILPCGCILDLMTKVLTLRITLHRLSP